MYSEFVIENYNINKRRCCDNMKNNMLIFQEKTALQRLQLGLMKTIFDLYKAISIKQLKS